MRSVEIQALSVGEAVRLALAELGCSEDEVTVEVLEEGDEATESEALVRVTLNQREPVRNAAQTPTAGRTSVTQETEQIAKQVVSDLLERMGFDCTVMAVDNPSSMDADSDEPPTVFIDVLGQDLGMLIGRRGDNLVQFQYMVNLLVNQELDVWTRVIVDVEGYRIRREESLVGLAHRVARQVARNKRSVSLEPMPANERRIVHIALREDPSVTTHSSGEGNLRRVTVEPNE